MPKGKRRPPEIGKAAEETEAEIGQDHGPSSPTVRRRPDRAKQRAELLAALRKAESARGRQGRLPRSISYRGRRRR